MAGALLINWHRVAVTDCRGCGVCMIMTEPVRLPNRRHTQCPSLIPHSHARKQIHCSQCAIVFYQERREEEKNSPFIN